MWLSIHNVDELQEGDVVEFPSKVPDNRLILPGLEVPFVLHYGIVVIQDGEKKMGQTTFQQYPQIDSIEKTLNGRRINRIIRTGLPSDQLISNHKEVENKKYHWWNFNCEHYVKQMTGINPGIDQRITLGIAIIILLLIILIIFK